MVESVELVVAALAAGAAAGVGESASTAVKDAYAGVKAVALRLLRRESSVPSEVVAVVEADAVTAADDACGAEQRRELAAALEAAGAGADEELVAAALKVLELSDPVGSQAGKYRVSLFGNKGVQVGDHSVQTNHFS